MNKSKLARWVVVGGLLGVTALAVTLATAFPAQAADLTSGIRSFAQRGVGGVVDWWALLADELGISVDELEQAVDAANSAAIDQLVEAGVMTAEQGELAQARSDLRGYIDPQAIAAEALGMSVEDLQAARQDGSTLADLIEQQGLDRASYLENLRAAHEAAIQQAVDDGVITQAQADQLLENGRFPGFGRDHGQGRGPEFRPGGFGPGIGPGFSPGRGEGRGSGS